MVIAEVSYNILFISESKSNGTARRSRQEREKDHRGWCGLVLPAQLLLPPHRTREQRRCPSPAPSAAASEGPALAHTCPSAWKAGLVGASLREDGFWTNLLWFLKGLIIITSLRPAILIQACASRDTWHSDF